MGEGATLGVGDADVVQQRDSSRPRLGLFQPEVHAQRLGDLVADSKDRVQGAERVLEDHPDVVRAEAAQLARPHRQYVAPVERDLAGGDATG